MKNNFLDNNRFLLTIREYLDIFKYDIFIQIFKTFIICGFITFHEKTNKPIFF